MSKSIHKILFFFEKWKHSIDLNTNALTTKKTHKKQKITHTHTLPYYTDETKTKLKTKLSGLPITFYRALCVEVNLEIITSVRWNSNSKNK